MKAGIFLPFLIDYDGYLNRVILSSFRERFWCKIPFVSDLYNKNILIFLQH